MKLIFPLNLHSYKKDNQCLQFQLSLFLKKPLQTFIVKIRDYYLKLTLEFVFTKVAKK